MSDDDDTQDAPHPAAPEASRGWSEQDRRTLVITIVGGLAANLGTVILVGAALAYVHLSRHHNFSLAQGLIALLSVVLGALLIGVGYAVRRGRDFLFFSAAPGKPPWYGWLLLALGWFAVLEGVLIWTGLAAGVK